MFGAFDDEDQLSDMRRAAMARSFSWSGAAAEYEALYRRLIGPRLTAVRSDPRPQDRRSAIEALEPAA